MSNENYQPQNFNPYQVGSAQAPQPGYHYRPPPQNARPSGITIICVLMWVLVGLGILTTPFTLVSILAPESLPGSEMNPMVQVLDQNPGYRTFTLITYVLGLIVSVVAIIGSIGLWTKKRWGWSLSTFYCYYTFVAVVVGMIFNFGFLFPALGEVTSNNPSSAGGFFGGVAGGTCGTLFGLALPIAVLIVINKPQVKAWRDSE